MAKSKNGGSRAFIRGRIGSDVYSVGKNGSGQRQQVVRSLAVQVTNPRTSSQMFGRMIMSTVMQTVSALSEIIDHSFDGVAKGQPSISEFIRRNYQLVKADAIANPSANNNFGLVKFQEKGSLGGEYVISDGRLNTPTSIEGDASAVQFNTGAGDITVAKLIEAMGVSRDGYVTFVSIAKQAPAQIIRMQINPDLADSTVITSDNVASVFVIESTVAYRLEISNGKVVVWVEAENYGKSYGCILSDFVEGSWAHNTCTLENMSTPDYAADVALPTYPVGTAQFLNGGDI